MKRLLVLAGIILAAAPILAAAQITQTVTAVSVAWTPPAACTTSTPCVYAVWRAPQGSTAFTELTSTAPASPFLDNTVTAGSWQYTIQAIQSGSPGPPSAVGLDTIPASLGAPTGVTVTTVTTTTTVTVP